MKKINIIKKLTYFFYPIISDKLFLKIFIFIKTGKIINLKNPTTLTEKVNYLKTLDNSNKMAFSDKIYVKQLINNLGLDIKTSKTLWEGYTLKNLDWEKLPKEFVIKANHFSGDVTIVKNKEEIDKNKLIKYYKKILKLQYYKYARENSYKGIKPKLLIEEYLGDEKSVSDYKFFYFNGKFQFCHVVEDRFTDLKDYMVDESFNNLNFNLDTRSFIEFDSPRYKPKNYKLMIELSRKIAQKFDFVRVDLYEINEIIYFGECTFYPWGGAFRIMPKNKSKIIDLHFGEKLQISKKGVQYENHS